MNTKEYSETWFVQNIPIWEKILTPLIGKPVKALEVGCFEGRATVWLLQNILTNPEAVIYCVDPFESDEELKGANWLKIKQRFLNNTKEFGNKVILYEAKSEDYLRNTVENFDFIYVDGSHLAKDVFIDLALSHLLLRSNGILIADDWLWKGFEKDINLPKPAIDAFLECFAKEYKILSVGYQVALQKK